MMPTTTNSTRRMWRLPSPLVGAAAAGGGLEGDGVSAIANPVRSIPNGTCCPTGTFVSSGIHSPQEDPYAHHPDQTPPPRGWRLRQRRGDPRAHHQYGTACVRRGGFQQGL